MSKVTMWFVGLGLTAFLSVSCFSNAAVAEQPLIEFNGAQTRMACEFANHALAQGYFPGIENPQITGTCPDNPAPELEPVIDTPIIPYTPPIAPWCDCTDEEWKSIYALMQAQNVLINPGYQSADPMSDWAKAFNTDVSTIRSPEFWSSGQVPEFERLTSQRFLKAK